MTQKSSEDEKSAEEEKSPNVREVIKPDGVAEVLELQKQVVNDSAVSAIIVTTSFFNG